MDSAAGGRARFALTLDAGASGDLRLHGDVGTGGKLDPVDFIGRNVEIDGWFIAGDVLVDIAGSFRNAKLHVPAGGGLEVDGFHIRNAASVEAFGSIGGKDGPAAALSATAERRSADFRINGCVIGEVALCEPAFAGLPKELVRPTPIEERLVERPALVEQRIIERPGLEEEFEEGEETFSNRGNEELW